MTHFSRPTCPKEVSKLLTLSIYLCLDGTNKEDRVEEAEGKRRGGRGGGEGSEADTQRKRQRGRVCWLVVLT